MDDLIIRQPDDWHLHLRDGGAMCDVAGHSAAQFGRALIMPNLRPPILTAKDALAYRERILEALPKGASFEPQMALYLTQDTSKDEILKVKDHPSLMGFKLYPQGATTNSDSGVASLEAIYPILEHLAKADVPLMIHGEVTDREIDVFDREKVFLDQHLEALVKTFPELRIVLEHVTTKDGIEFVRSQGPKVAATLTAHHLIYNRNAMLVGGIRPHFFCLPILKRETHRKALLEAATSGNPKFFLGTDSAPHPKSQKESACGCAGCYTAFAAIELYAEAFESVGRLEALEGFASVHGASFYELPLNEQRITLKRSSWTAPPSLPFGDEILIPLRAGENLHWKMT